MNSPAQPRRTSSAHVICALSAEGRTARATGLPVTVCGVGAQRALEAAEHAVSQGAHLIISWGIAGALTPEFSRGQIVVPAQITDGRGRFWRSSAADTHGRLVSVTRVARTPLEKTRLTHYTGADIVDMESASLACACSDAGVEFAVVRAIYDDCDQTIPEWLVTLTDDHGRSRIFESVRLGARHPERAVSMGRTLLNYRCALRGLRDFARQPPAWLKAWQ